MKRISIFKVGKKAFTLLELIVSIIILIILATISFLSVVNHSKTARDSIRTSDISLIETALNIFYIDKGFYPDPTDSTSITYSGALAWRQGSFGDRLLVNLSLLSKRPLDPLTQGEYSYSTTNNKSEYQLGTIEESGSFGSINGKDIKKAYVKGNYNEKAIKVSTGSIDYLIAVPSIISSDLGNTDLVDSIDNKSLVFNGYYNIPDSYGSDHIESKGGFDYTPNKIVAFSGSVNNDLRDVSNQIDFLRDLQIAYSGTIIENENNYGKITNIEIDPENPSIDSQILSAGLVNEILDLGVDLVNDNFVPETSTGSINNLFVLEEINNLGGTNADEFSSVIKNGSNYIAVGLSRSDLNGLSGGNLNSGNVDFVIAKFDSNLNLLDINNFGGTGNDVFSGLTFDGTNFVAVGYSSSDLSSFTGGTTSQGLEDAIIAKINTDLDLIEIKSMGGVSPDILNDVIYDSGNYISVGYSISDLSGYIGLGGNDDVNEFGNNLIVKFDSSLNLIGINNFGSVDNGGIWIKVINDGGNYIAVGNIEGDLDSYPGGTISSGSRDFLIAEFDSSLNLVKLNNFGGSSYDYLGSLIKNGSSYITVGYSSSDLSSFSGGSTSVGSSDFVILEIDSNLDLIKLNNFGGTSYEGLYSLIFDGDNFVSVGYTNSDLSSFTGGSVSSGRDFFIGEFDLNLDLNKVYNFGGSSSDYLYDVILDGTNYISIGRSPSDLSSHTGGSVSSGFNDFVISEF